jgi:hypothetical protein
MDEKCGSVFEVMFSTLRKMLKENDLLLQLHHQVQNRCDSLSRMSHRDSIHLQCFSEQSK